MFTTRKQEQGPCLHVWDTHAIVCLSNRMNNNSSENDSKNTTCGYNCRHPCNNFESLFFNCISANGGHTRYCHHNLVMTPTPFYRFCFVTINHWSDAWPNVISTTLYNAQLLLFVRIPLEPSILICMDVVFIHVAITSHLNRFIWGTINFIRWYIFIPTCECCVSSCDRKHDLKFCRKVFPNE